jgi:uncharacterized RDD family membrane protein YckC
LRKADLTSRAAAALVDLLIIMGLARLPDIIGFLAAAGYILIRDGLFDRRSIGKKLVGLQVVSSEGRGPALTYRESIIRNLPIVTAYFLFLIPYAGWVLGPAVLGVEFLTAIGDSAGMRVGDMLARTHVALAVPAAADRPPDPGPSGEASADTKAT